MGLNQYRDEAGDFMKALGGAAYSTAAIADMLREELNLLEKAVDDAPRLRHQIHDVLFLLFELAAIRDFDLDEEWRECLPRAYAKYVDGKTDREVLD